MENKHPDATPGDVAKAFPDIIKSIDPNEMQEMMCGMTSMVSSLMQNQQDGGGSMLENIVKMTQQ